MSTACVVVPAWNAAHHLRRSLPPLLAAGHPVLVVDDGSDDDTAALARALGAQVLPSRRQGPAGARNLGAAAAPGDTLLFVDADVVVHDGALAALLATLREDVVAAFGSYDDRPGAAGFVSRWKNLQHHHVHQRSPGEASTFWAGLGAVRRHAFEAVGGFDAAAFPRPSIEDIDLGYRLRAQGGRIVSAPHALGSHLKRWTLATLISTDVRRRAIPWARLLRHPAARPDLNVAWRERARAALALGWSVSLPLLATPAAPLSGALLAAAALANARLLTLYARREGLPFAVVAALLLQGWYLAAVAGWLVGRATASRSVHPSSAPPVAPGPA